MKILLALTFVFGVIQLLTFIKIFDTRLAYILTALFPHNEKTTFGLWCGVLNIWFFYFSLVFQAWYWLFGGKL